MFTGIVEELGTIQKIRSLPDSASLTIQAAKVLDATQIGDSIAVNGACLTVVALSEHDFTVDIMAETLRKTSLAGLNHGAKVNLERALQLQTRLGGHLVSGHIDGVGIIQRLTRQGIATIAEISLPPELLPYLLPKGSVAIDGISLTIVEVFARSFTISLIPHTCGQTTLGFKGVGDPVNLETDMIGKYVARLLTNQRPDAPAGEQLSYEFLLEHGFI
ncbi:MAG: riboflavin synthase [Peptococcaceae bacterium]|jgi:riboflavin synthase|nr:riboflavin synthase [Peptococcaceae bacterium]